MKNYQLLTKHFFRLALTLVMLVGLALGMLPASTTLASTQTDLIGPVGSGQFGKTVMVLPNGNIVVTDPSYSLGALANVGAVYLYNGSSSTLISTLTGGTANDRVGSGAEYGSLVSTGSISVLSSGDFVVTSPSWANGASSKAGAVTWCSATTGCAGAVSASNSLVGSTANDSVGSESFIVNLHSYINLLGNGNYVVVSPDWANGAASYAGAVTWCNGTTGCKGAVSTSNSLVGSKAGDMSRGANGVRGDVIMLSNGNYVVTNAGWDNNTTANVGAVTWCSGTTGCMGVISASNSLVGSSLDDGIGSNGITALTNGNYVVGSRQGVAVNGGMVTWCSGTVGCRGVVSASNSLVGSTAGDNIGRTTNGIGYYGSITALTNGSYVVRSSEWANGTASKAGAVTWCDGMVGCKGAVSAANSLVGSAANDQIGLGAKELTNGSYVVSSPEWANGAASKAGAVTWCSGTTGCTGVVSAGNSLVGSTASDLVGNGPTDNSGNVTALTNGNYVVRSPTWDKGAISDAGAATWCSGAAGCTGVISASNSLVGSTANDKVGSSYIWKLTNGNYVVGSPNWDKGTISDAGAATRCSGTAGCTGAISASNSLVGSTASDQVGLSVTTLTNGNYVVGSPNWDKGAIIDAGAATWCSGAAGCTGAISASNSLVGSTVSDQVGIYVTALSNGNYVVSSYDWDSGSIIDVGAATWCSGAVGCTGVVSASNSLVGSIVNDQVGYDIRALGSGNYVVSSPNWTNAAAAHAGAVTWCSGTLGCMDVAITSGNSVLGTAANGGSNWNFAFDDVNNQLVVGRPSDNRVTLFKLNAPAPTIYIYLPWIRR